MRWARHQKSSHQEYDRKNRTHKRQTRDDCGLWGRVGVGFAAPWNRIRSIPCLAAADWLSVGCRLGEVPLRGPLRTVARARLRDTFSAGKLVQQTPINSEWPSTLASCLARSSLWWSLIRCGPSREDDDLRDHFWARSEPHSSLHRWRCRTSDGKGPA